MKQKSGCCFFVITRDKLMFAMDFNGIFLSHLTMGWFRFAEFDRNSFTMTNDQLEDMPQIEYTLTTINHDVVGIFCATPS